MNGVELTRVVQGSLFSGSHFLYACILLVYFLCMAICDLSI